MYKNVSTLVYDVVQEVKWRIHRNIPGGTWYYIVEKKFAVDEKDIHDPRSGYINFAGDITKPVIHDDRRETVIRSVIDSDSDKIIDILQSSGLSYNRHALSYYKKMLELEYSLNWNSHANIDRNVGKILPNEVAVVLDWISSKPSDDQIKSFLSHDVSDECLSRALNPEKFSEWGIMVDYNLLDAFRFLAMQSLDEIIQSVRQYRQGVLNGEQKIRIQKSHSYDYYGLGLDSLFPLNEARNSGRWPKKILSFLNSFDYDFGSGKTRVKRVRKFVLTGGWR
jgi:hypothetical protein